MSVIVTEPVAAPVVVGSKITLMVQLVPGAREVPQVPRLPNTNGPLMVKPPLNVSVDVPVLVSVEYVTTLMPPVAMEGKASDVGESTAVSAAVDSPVPLRLTCRALPLDGAMLNIAPSVPAAFGVKVTLMAHFAPAATDVPH